MNVWVEQVSSLVEALKKSGACQGDLVQARLVAGVVQMEDCTPCLCFCPVALSLESFTQKGWPWQRSQNHSNRLTVVNAPELAKELCCFCGMVSMRVQIRWTRSFLKMTAKLSSVELFPVEGLPCSSLPAVAELPFVEYIGERGECEETVIATPLTKEGRALRTRDGHFMAVEILQKMNRPGLVNMSLAS